MLDDMFFLDPSSKLSSLGSVSTVEALLVAFRDGGGWSRPNSSP